MGFLDDAVDKAKGLVDQNDEKVDDAIEKAGDLVDDYYVDPRFRNDHQLLFDLELADGELRRITLHPTFIDDCRTAHATAVQRDWTFRKMTDLCGEFRTPVRQAGEHLLIDPAAPWRGGRNS